MLTGRYWILPDGSALSVEQTGTEHANLAKRFLLGVGDHEGNLAPTPKTFKALTKAEADHFLARGVDPGIVAFFEKDGPDGRMLAMRTLGWIRTAQSIFNVWTFNEKALQAIQDATGFWKLQTKVESYDSVEMNEESSQEMYRIPVKALLNPGAEIGALKHIGAGVGRWRNPYGKRRDKY